MYVRQNGKERETESDSVYQKREVVGKREREEKRCGGVVRSGGDVTLPGSG